MHDIPTLLLASMAAFLASVLYGVTGFGGGIIFLPVLVAAYGVRPAVPILAVSLLLGSAFRGYINRTRLDLRVIGLFSAAAIPFTVLGSYVYVALPESWIKKALGLFMLISVLGQHFGSAVSIHSRRVFFPLGAVAGFLSAVVGSIGPICTPFFLAYGLTTEAFIGTDALCAAGIHFARSSAYFHLGILAPSECFLGLIFGLCMLPGSCAGKLILKKLSPGGFRLIVESLLAVTGLYMLVL